MENDWVRAKDLKIGDVFQMQGIKHKVRKIEDGKIWFGSVQGFSVNGHFGSKSMCFVLKIESHPA